MADKLRVLYVDNEPGLLEIGKLFLEREGSFAVDTFLSAKQAFEQLKTEKYDAIISDYQMPEMDGISFLKRLKASDDTTPFIIFTAKGREDVVIEALNNGADFYVQIGGESNSQFAELSNKIRYAVSRKRAEESLRKREEQLSLAIEASGAGLWDWKVQTGEVIF
ncbi:MAG: response regulator, partial [Methanomicrobiales archaeon]